MVWCKNCRKFNQTTRQVITDGWRSEHGSRTRKVSFCPVLLYTVIVTSDTRKSSLRSSPFSVREQFMDQKIGSGDAGIRNSSPNRMRSRVSVSSCVKRGASRRSNNRLCAPRKRVSYSLYISAHVAGVSVQACRPSMDFPSKIKKRGALVRTHSAFSRSKYGVYAEYR